MGPRLLAMYRAGAWESLVLPTAAAGLGLVGLGAAWWCNVNRAFSAALARAGLVHRSPHRLRHDFAGLLLAGGVPGRVTQELMRHTTYGLTANVYQQPPEELQRAGAKVVDQLLGESSSVTPDAC
jgi:integrase